MIEYRVRKIERFEVTRYSDMNADIGVTTVASDLTESQANDISGAMHAKAHEAGMYVRSYLSDGSQVDGCPDRHPI